MKLKAEHGAIEVRALGIRLTQESTREEVAQALKAAPQIEQFLEKDGATRGKTKD